MTIKYELTDETMIVGNTVFHRIRALVYIPKYNVKAGDLGGFIEKESNLSHDGECWIGNNACAYDNAYVYGNARVYDNARICDNVHVGGDAWIFGNACISNDASILGNAHIFGYAYIHGNARIFGNSCVYDNARVLGNACICGNACVCGDACVYGNAYTYGNARIYGNACVYGNTRIFGNACIYGDACVSGGAWITQGKYHISTMHITVLPYGITAIYPNHVQIGCQLFEICDKEKAIETMEMFNISREYHEQIWLSVQLCKQWLKDNPEKGDE